MAKKKKTYLNILRKKLGELELNSSFRKSELIIKFHKKYDAHLDHCFSSLFFTAKKDFPEKEFRSINGAITRIK